MEIEKILPKIKKNILLKNYTTFKIGGRAQYFFVAKKKEDLILAVKTAKKFNLPFFILGRGSNILVSDKGYNGLIIKMQNAPKESIRLPTGQAKIKNIYAESGIRLSDLVKLSLDKSLAGLEWAAGIPGTVGGAIWGNAGAFGNSMADVVKSVEVLEVGYGEIGSPSEIRSLRNKDCKFKYRDSIFKHNKNLIILSATLQLKKGNKKEIKNKIKGYLNCRKQKQPLNFPSAGSIFKNPPGKFAGELIERCGLKGKKIGNVKISDAHANFILNLGKGEAKDVKKLIKLAKQEVKNRFGVVLEEEIQHLGFGN